MNCVNFRIFQSVFIIFFFTSISSAAQPAGQMVLHHINEENGLTDNHVQCIYKDANEFVWIGTLSGLNLLDGSTITVFKNDTGDSSSVSDNDILSLAGDNKGVIWVGTNTGLNSLNVLTGKFTRYHLPKNNFGERDAINSIATDKTGAVYIGTPRGLFCYENKTIASIVIPGNKNDLRKNNWITSLAISKNGVLWATTYNGLWSVNISNHKITHEISKANDPNFVELFTTVIEDHNGQIWVGTWDGSLKTFDPQTKKILTYVAGSGPGNITTIAETKQPDGHHLLWVNGTLVTFDPAQKKFIHQPLPYNISTSFNIKEIYATPDNWLWIGNDEGLYIYNPAKSLFRHQIFSTPISGQGVAILAWHKKILVTGSGNNFLKAYNENLSLVDDYSDKKIIGNLSCLSPKLSGVESLKAGTSDGIVDINLRTHKIKLHPLDFLAKTFEAGNFITNMLEDKTKTWWIFPWRNGIWVTDSLYNNFHEAFHNFISEGGKPKSLVIGDAVEDKNGNLWFADYDEGIIFYNKALKKFSKPFKEQLGERYSTSQLLYHKNNCYTFLNTEILIWNCDTATIHKIELPPQMDKQIISMAIDSSENIWLATRQGLIVYNTSAKYFDHFTTADGLIKNDMNGSLICLSDGTMVFGSAEYLTAFNPAEIFHSMGSAPGIILTQYLANGKNVINHHGKMKFNYSVNNYIFKWAVTDYNDPLNNNYYYKLGGIDSAWRYAGNRGAVEFANLSPGNYTLLLRGANANRIYAKNIITVNFEIAPPFWRTWWFLFLCIMAVVSIFYLIYRYRVNEILKIQRLRNKISLDLHDDIGSTLSSISLLSEMALRQKKEDKDVEMLQEIKQNSLSLMERMDDIVWSINPKNDSLENLLIRIKDFASRLFDAKEINYNIDIGENAKELYLTMEYRQHLYLIMKEAINNLVKYSNCTTAEVLVYKNHPNLNVIIKDNGIGFNTEDQPRGNGLLSIKKRAQQLNAHLEIKSEINNGTTISLAVKIK